MMDLAHSDAVLLCRRNATGHVVALTRQTLSAQEMQAGGWVAVSPADAEVQAFTRDVASQANPMSRTDVGLARAFEDLVDVLIKRGLIQFTDLPLAAQAKLIERRQTRADMAHWPELLPDEGDSVRL